MSENKKNSHYISAKESRRIVKENMKAIRYYEKRKKRKIVESEFVTEMKDEKNVVEFDNLHTYFFGDAGTVKAVNGVTFSVPQGATVGVVGESGCGKSVTSLSLMQLVQAPSGQIVEGSIRFQSDAFKRDEKGKKIPVYETEIDENGNEIIKRDEKGKPIIKKNELGGNMYEMEKKTYDFKKIGINETEIIKELFAGVFTIEPWNDDWSNQEQLNLYLLDLIGQSNSLTYGLFENRKLIGVSMGHIKHWYSGTEYYIEELCIQTNKQGNGIGTYFLKEIEKAIKELGLVQIFLQTESTVPAYEFYQKNGFCELKEHVSFAKRI